MTQRGRNGLSSLCGLELIVDKNVTALKYPLMLFTDAQERENSKKTTQACYSIYYALKYFCFHYNSSFFNASQQKSN